MKDLNMENYDFQDLLQVFKIDIEQPIKFQIEKKKNHLNEITKKYDTTTCSFFQKVFTIIACVGELEDQSFILDIKDEECIYNYISKIKKVDNYHKKDTEEIIHQFTNKTFLLEKADLPIFPITNPSPVINSFPNPVAEGNVNYLKRMVQTTNLHLNTCFRENYYNSNPCDFHYMLPVSIQSTISIQLSSIELPNSWYLFSHLKQNNLMKIQFHCETYDIFIPSGNYDISSLPHYLNSTYFYLSDTETDLRYLKIQIHPTTCKTEIGWIEERCETFNVLFNENPSANIMQKLGWTLGFRLANYMNVRQILSEGLYDGGGDRYIYVSVNDYQNNVNENNVVCFDKSILDQYVIAKIPLVNGKFSITSNDYNGLSLSKIRKYNGPVNIRRLHIKLMDKFGEVIDLNNMDYSLTFEMEILYENLF